MTDARQICEALSSGAGRRGRSRPGGLRRWWSGSEGGSMGSSPQRMKADNKRAGKKGSLPRDQQFVQLINSFRQEPAYRALSYGARCLYTELRAAYNKFNNGKIMCSGGHAANLIGCAKSSAVKYLGELKRHGFIVEMKRGSIGIDGYGQGTFWRLTELGCAGVNNGRPTKDYQNWKPEKNKSPYRNSVQGIPKNGALKR